MTKTEQFKATWATLQSEDAIHKMIAECICHLDDLNSAKERFERVILASQAKARITKLNNISDQLKMSGITFDDLKSHMQRNPVKYKKSKPGKMHVATVDGVKIFRGLSLPEVAKSKGWNRINKIPEEFLTEEYKLSKK